ncbi:DNA polymerase IV [Leucobacter soli]|uniref:DNA polymerase IV n=1 Tax=Leucobacter soli TaxID=2812850 RepID=A0A916JU75_9MICO|nr:DNA polymerase Y family protein [Leucobacter soli]CAG7601491.1 DNA polymerase IV [Leucobacter soli]
MSSAERVMALRVPDWPIRAHLIERKAGVLEQNESGRIECDDSTEPRTAPLALVANRLVVACDEAARMAGLHVGLRQREAQSRCPDLEIHPHDPEVDERRFAPILVALERLIPGIEPLRPGLCAMRARGPARYYGDERRAAGAILDLLSDLGLPESLIGIADGRFAAEQAALAGPGDPGIAAPLPGLRLVQPGDSPAFLEPLPVDRATDGDFAEVLRGLGIRTLGALAALPEEAVGQRFGAAGLSAHRRATGRGAAHGTEIRPRDPAREHVMELPFEPPVETSEQLAFACMALAERFIGGLTEIGLVGTALRIELTDDTGARYERVWLHPDRFTAADTVNRIRWQADALPRVAERGGSGIARVRLSPAHTDRIAAHEPGLWNTGADERVHHHLSRAQSRLGRTGVGTMELTGGRLLADRQRFVPWGTGRRAQRTRDAGPWPGAVPGPAPGVVFPDPMPVGVVDAEGRTDRIDDEDLLTAKPAQLRMGGAADAVPVRDWSLPWPVRERGWTGAPARFRLQLQLEDGDAWLVFHESGSWFAEGRYD